MQAKNALLALNRCVKVRASQGALGGRSWPAFDATSTAACLVDWTPVQGRSHRVPPGVHSAGRPVMRNRSHCCLAAPQVYPAVKVDASKLIDLLKPIRWGGAGQLGSSTLYGQKGAGLQASASRALHATILT